jgi:mRNA-degrading endonuclease YafQ of YafQ-DinJ toxin-antitoxin module
MSDDFRKDHCLSGNWKHHRDCHIEPDWLLLYKIDGDDLNLVPTPQRFGVNPTLYGPNPTWLRPGAI